MDEHDLDILARLDTQLPLLDGEIERIDARLHRLADTKTLADLLNCYRAGLARFGDRCTDPAHGSITPADIEFLFDAVHQSLPPGIDPAVISALDHRLARLIEIGANIASNGPPLT
jgi:hypothetical protein